MRNKTTRRVTPIAVAATVHGLFSAEKGRHEHLPHDLAFDFYGSAAKTAAAATTTPVAGLPLIDLTRLR